MILTDMSNELWTRMSTLGRGGAARGLCPMNSRTLAPTEALFKCAGCFRCRLLVVIFDLKNSKEGRVACPSTDSTPASARVGPAT